MGLEPCSGTLGAVPPTQTQGLHLPKRSREHASKGTGGVDPAQCHSCKAGGSEQSTWDNQMEVKSLSGATVP